jgi:hypothetical protein
MPEQNAPEEQSSGEQAAFKANENEYANLANLTEKEQAMLDLSTPEMTQRFAEAPVYIKSAVVEIREAAPGEKLTTTLADGRDETVNTAKDGDYVVTNPGGEQYFIGAQKVADRYTDIGDGRYQAKGACRAFQNPTGGEVTIIAPWGEEQHGGSDAMLAVLYDPENPDEVGSDRYIIGGEEFKNTYAPAPE